MASALFEGRWVILAPLAGVSDVIFRQLCVEAGAQLTYTEMVSAKALSYSNAKTQNMLALAPNETQVVVQLFGHEPAVMAAQAYELEQTLGSKLFAIDINMGCPARKVSGKGEGAGLMKQPVLAAEITHAVAHAVTCPVSVKFRRGYELNEESAPEFARRMEAAGAAAVAVHGRFAKQYYRGLADWGVIARVKQAVSIPVIGNGDVVNAQTALALREQTGCDAIMVGRGAQGRPWVFSEITAALQGRAVPEPPSIEARMALAKRHAFMMEQAGTFPMARMRKHAMWYVAGVPNAAAVRRKFNTACTYKDFATIFDEVVELAHAAEAEEAEWKSAHYGSAVPAKAVVSAASGNNAKGAVQYG